MSPFDGAGLCERLQKSLAEHARGPVEVIETHISWVLLTDRWALKLKKPVKFDFLDFSTLARRRQACEEEVRLNRRLAHDVYVGVVAVAIDDEGNVHLEETPIGEAVDWLVKMHRLPADRGFDRLIEANAVTGDQITKIARLLSAFYANSSPINLDVDAYRDRLVSLIQHNRESLLDANLDHVTPAIKRIHSAQLGFLQLSPEIFAARARSRIVDGHGDLRPEHIYLAPDPVVIDCIEFNAEMRQIDVADELAFLEMECDIAGAPEIGERIGRECLAAIPDSPPPDLIAFYKSYRACVRAKVLALRAGQVGREEAAPALRNAERYLSLANNFAAHLGPPVLVVVRGLMGTGKSTIAESVAKTLGAEHLQTDVIRRDLFGASEMAADYGEGNYTPNRRGLVYDEMFVRAERSLSAGVSVILDGTFLTEGNRKRAATIAAEHDAAFLIANCCCPDDVVLRRIAARQSRGDSASEARGELLEQQRADEEPIHVNQPQCDVDTRQEPAKLRESILRRLRELRQ